MLAKIFVNQKTKGQFDKFDYKVTPNLLPELSPDIFVEINFGNRKKMGIVSSITRKSSVRKLKPINKILYPGLKIYDWQKQLAHFIASEYATSFSEALFSIIPKLARTSSYPTSRPASTARQESFITGSKLDRFLAFRKIKQKKIIIFPEILEAQIYQKYFEKNATLYHAGLSTKKKSAIYISALTGNYQTIVGTYSAMFLSFCNAQLVMESFLSAIYGKDNSPKYNVLELAKKLAQIKQIKLILADDIDDPLSFYRLGQNAHIKFHLSISPQQLLSSIKFSGKNLVYFPTALHYRLIKCTNCQQILKCNQCHKILSSGEKTKPLLCNYCHTTQSDNGVCPKCRSPKLKFLMPGIRTIYDQLKVKNFVICDRDTVSLPANFANIVATNRIFSFPMKKFDTVWAFFPSFYFNIASFRQKENIAYLINRLDNLSDNLNIAVSSKMQIRFIREILSPKFAQQELTMRKKYHFPPFWNLWILRGEKISLGKFQEIVYNLESDSQAELIHKTFKGGQVEIYLKALASYKLKYDQIIPLVAQKNSEMIY